MRSERLLLALLLTLPLAGCKGGEPEAEPEPQAAEPVAFVPRDEIVICGERFSIGTPVVLWSDPGGYDAYATDFDAAAPPENVDRESGRRYTPGRVERDGAEQVLVPPDCADVATLATVVDQFVVHYDAAATSQRCFEVLQDQRGLSVHFLLDVDGTIYQTLDCREQAWHAAKANTRSIGIEIAQIGAFPPNEVRALEGWYARDRTGPYLKLPADYGDGGVRTEGFVARPRTPSRISGVIHGRPYSQYDYTPQQYDSLAKLLARITRELPRIRIDVPRGPDRRPLAAVLSDPEYDVFSGILGHYHITDQKIDPGPVFEFEPFLIAVRREQGKLPYRAPASKP